MAQYLLSGPRPVPTREAWHRPPAPPVSILGYVLGFVAARAVRAGGTGPLAERRRCVCANQRRTVPTRRLALDRLTSGFHSRGNCCTFAVAARMILSSGTSLRLPMPSTGLRATRTHEMDSHCLSAWSSCFALKFEIRAWWRCAWCMSPTPKPSRADRRMPYANPPPFSHRRSQTRPVLRVPAPPCTCIGSSRPPRTKSGSARGTGPTRRRNHPDVPDEGGNQHALRIGPASRRNHPAVPAGRGHARLRTGPSHAQRPVDKWLNIHAVGRKGGCRGWTWT